MAGRAACIEGYDRSVAWNNYRLGAFGNSGSRGVPDKPFFQVSYDRKLVQESKLNSGQPIIRIVGAVH